MHARTVLLTGILMLSSSAFGAPVLEEPLTPERTRAVSWPDELERRVLALAAPALQVSGPREPQTSPRYASHEIAALDSGWFGCGWLFDAPPMADRALLELAGTLIAGRSESILARQLVDRGLAMAVEVRLSDQGEKTLFGLFVLGSPLGGHTNVGDIVEGAISALSVSGPTAAELDVALRAAAHAGLAGVTRNDVRSAVTRYLVPQRRAVVELLPRNAPDPALSVKPPKGSTQSARATRGSSGRPTAVAHERVRANRRDPVLHETVERGDTLIAIARRHKVSVSDLARKNKLDPARPIRVGQKLVVPPIMAVSSEPRARSGTVAKSSNEKPAPARLRNRPKPRSL